MATLLSAADYAVFAICLAISAGIGIFFAVMESRNKSAGTEDYLLGGRQLGMVPVALSMSVSFMSAITVLGTPAEIYQYGTMFVWFLLCYLVVSIITSEVYIPTFYNMGISSTYEYLEKRFNGWVQRLGTLNYVANNLLYMGVVIYAPSLALNQVTGFDLWLSIIVVGAVCIFYTTLGGIKAVIWTDVFQALIMVIGFVSISIQGTMKVGSYEKVWQTCLDNDRIDFIHFEFDPRVRHSFWSIMFGGMFLWLGYYAVGQTTVQRILACKSVNQAKGAIFLNWIGLCLIVGLCCFNGTILYAYYADCDPVTLHTLDPTQGVSASDQLIPYFTLDIFSDFPGMNGIIMSCIFSGSLSTVSSTINAMAAVLIEDWLRPFTSWNDKTYLTVSKVSVAIFGGLAIAMAYLVSELGDVLTAALSLAGMMNGPLVGLFTLGLMFPFTNSLGAFVALSCGMGVDVWVYLGSQAYPQSNEFIRKLDFSTAACNLTNVETSTSIPDLTTTESSYPPVAEFYGVSYLYYGTIGFTTTLLVGTILSLLTGGWSYRHTVDPKYLYSFLEHWCFAWLPSSVRKLSRWGIDFDKEPLKEEKDEFVERKDALQYYNSIKVEKADEDFINETKI